jgi:hypothetical protein
MAAQAGLTATARQVRLQHTASSPQRLLQMPHTIPHLPQHAYCFSSTSLMSSGSGTSVLTVRAMVADGDEAGNDESSPAA